ncbi:protein of unknown function (plasmid) [Rhodovastum atsumiense]|nr:protein of unknown function [Rhodovastum atsumiense]
MVRNCLDGTAIDSVTNRDESGVRSGVVMNSGLKARACRCPR